jgi:hypothetical protein
MKLVKLTNIEEFKLIEYCSGTIITRSWEPKSVVNVIDSFWNKSLDTNMLAFNDVINY